MPREENTLTLVLTVDEAEVISLGLEALMKRDRSWDERVLGVATHMRREIEEQGLSNEW